MICRLRFSKQTSVGVVFGFAAILFTVVLPQKSNAQNVEYDFVESQGNQILATFELSELPAFGGDIVSVTFTELGNTTFGFGLTYDSTFISNFNRIVDDGMDGLQGGSNLDASQIIDTSPPVSDLEITSNGDSRFLLGLSSATGLDRLVFISPGSAAGGAELFITSDGDFRISSAVPEPSSFIIMTLMVIGFTGRRQRRIE